MNNELHFLENFIANTADQFLGINGPDPILKHSRLAYQKSRRGMLFSGSLRLTLPYDHEFKVGEPEPRVIRHFDIIITEYHNVFVRWYYGEQRHTGVVPNPREFVNTGNHDSCWKQMDYTKMHSYFGDMYSELNGLLMDNGCDTIAPKQMELEVRLGDWLGMHPFQFVEVSMRHPNGDFYFYDLISIKFKKVTMDFVEEAE